MGKTFDMLQTELIHFYSPNNWKQYDKQLSEVDRLRWNNFYHNFINKELIPEIREKYNLPDDKFVINFNRGNGCFSKAPWMKIQTRHANANGPESYYIALIYSPANNAILMNITTSSTYARDLELTKEQTSAINERLKKYVEIQIKGHFDNEDFVHNAIVPGKNNKDMLANWYLASSVFYKYLSFDESNWSLIMSTLNGLIDIWKKSVGFVEPAEFINKQLMNPKQLIEDSKKDKKLSANKNDYLKDNDFKVTFTEGEFITVKTPVKAYDPNKKKKLVSRRDRANDTKVQQTIGEVGEERVRQWACDKLIDAGHPELAKQVKIKSTDGDGYDIDSFSLKTFEPIKIEVKSSKNKMNNILISANELKEVLNNKVEVYVAENVTSSNVNISKLLIEGDIHNEEMFIPTQYSVKVRRIK